MAKRLFDILLSAAGLVILLPIMAAVALAIIVVSPGPVFYRGRRVGKNGKIFKIFKFRTMIVDAELSGDLTTADNDPRTIPIGNFLRKYKLDELPQLFNVLRGEMSIVGPRPQFKHYVDRYNDEEKLILSVKPGMTDYASIKFINLGKIVGGNKDAEAVYLAKVEPEKNRLRIKYAKEGSFLVDIKIIAMTVFEIARVLVLNRKSKGQS